MRGGWYLVAFESQLTGDITPIDVGATPIILVADGDRIRCFDATCPHQGANLGYGGRLDGRGIVCPFHGKRITLGSQVGIEYCVREYATLGYGGMVFVLLTEQHENGLHDLLQQLVVDHIFMPFNCTLLSAAGELVIENAFDASHFRPVHGVRNSPRLTVRRTEEGSFIAEGELHVAQSTWYRAEADAALRIPFKACALSPHLVFSHMTGDDPYWVITGTTPTGDGCLVRQSLAIPRADGAVPARDRVEYLAKASKEGLEQDRIIWEHLRPPTHPRYAPDDAALLAFREFCLSFDPPN
jgi:phenylpropionate dioxygenase-like ring-hydroxylating dioxygenase large terminal subunit